MSRNISTALRQQVGERAGFRCEYCLVFEVDTFFRFQIDHIESVKHGGGDIFENLAFACPDCNRNKGSDLGTKLETHPTLVRFFNPRVDNWNDHFEIASDGVIYARSPEGMATIKIFQLNIPVRVMLRKELILSGRYLQRHGNS